MPAIAGQRCWQNLKIIGPLSSFVIYEVYAYHLATLAVSEQVPAPDEDGSSGRERDE